jgi:phenylacetate-CoA ligase
MSKFFDRLETRSPASREAALFRALRGVLSVARPRAPALRAQLRGIEIAKIRCRNDLAQIPVIRKSGLKAMQAQAAPFGGLAATRTSALKRLLVSPGPIFEPEGYAEDWWGAARALFAAGLRKGDILINCFSYHLTPGGHIMESGAHALGCAVIPAGVGNAEQQVEAIHFLRPRAYCGTADFLKILLDRGGDLKRDISSLRTAMVSGAALPAGLRAELVGRSVNVFQAYATADLGVVAYESEAFEGLIVNEGVLLEIVRPGTNIPVGEGEMGEIVVTRLNHDYPLLRFGTGDLSALMKGPSPCGRTNLRIRGFMGRTDQTTKIKGMFVHPAHLAEIGKRHPELIKLRLVVTRSLEQDVMILKAEGRANGKQLCEAVEMTLQSVTKLKGKVEILPPGALPDDGKIIADERAIGS